MDWRIQMGDIYNFFVCLSSMYFIYFQFNLRNVSAVDWRIQTGDIDKWFNSETRTRNRDNEGGSTLKMLKGFLKPFFGLFLWILDQRWKEEGGKILSLTDGPIWMSWEVCCAGIRKRSGSECMGSTIYKM